MEEMPSACQGPTQPMGLDTYMWDPLLCLGFVPASSKEGSLLAPAPLVSPMLSSLGTSMQPDVL